MILLLASWNDIWSLIRQPVFAIVYIAVMVLLMLLIVIMSMLDERRFNNVTARLEQNSTDDDGSRFGMLKSLDEQPKLAPPPLEITLERFCNGLRSYAADELGLYYEIASVRELVAGMAVSNFIILQGMSGTGKTSLAFALGEFLSNPSLIVPVQPMWKERSDLLGYYNEFTKKFNETRLLQKMYEANGDGRIFVTVLDELNIARVEYYFAEFLSLMEIPNPESRYLEIVSDQRDDDPVRLKNGCIRLPENIWFLGTANNDDSTFAISDKVYDRAMVLDFDSKAEPFKAEKTTPVPLSYAQLRQLSEEAMRRGVEDATMKRLSALDEYLSRRYKISFGNRIMKQIGKYLPVYVACGGTELDALDDILSKKVFRKLETVSFKGKDAEELTEKLKALFGAGTMKKCEACAAKLARNG